MGHALRYKINHFGRSEVRQKSGPLFPSQYISQCILLLLRARHVFLCGTTVHLERIKFSRSEEYTCTCKNLGQPRIFRPPLENGSLLARDGRTYRETRRGGNNTVAISWPYPTDKGRVGRRVGMNKNRNEKGQLLKGNGRGEGAAIN